DRQIRLLRPRPRRHAHPRRLRAGWGNCADQRAVGSESGAVGAADHVRQSHRGAEQHRGQHRRAQRAERHPDRRHYVGERRRRSQWQQHCSVQQRAQQQQHRDSESPECPYRHRHRHCRSLEQEQGCHWPGRGGRRVERGRRDHLRPV
ncbi:MAG: hypothetical protein AVDCRST_MAG11-1517, partial [uncultured Gemmatimonadaceae bacterium]